MKEPDNCPYCNAPVNYHNYKEHLYMYCTSTELERKKEKQ